jgi:hypothetical protein
MTTGKQIEANRRNAQKSTGPKTREGKRIVAQNAVTHGMAGLHPVILPGDEQLYQDFAEPLRAQYHPVTPMEEMLVKRLVDCAWRLQRAPVIESGILRAHLPADGDAHTALGRTYQRNAGTLSRLSRHERALERSLHDAIRQLQIEQYARLMDCDRYFVSNMAKFPAIDAKVAKKKEEGNYFSPQPGQELAP